MESTQEAPAQTKPQTIADIIVAKKDSFAAIGTKYLSAERLIKLAHLVLTKVPNVGKCTPASVIDALSVCARLGLEPNEPGGVWIVPYEVRIKFGPRKGDKQFIATPIIDYRGMIDVCRRSGEIAAVHAAIRYKNDEWQFGLDTTSPTMVSVKHKPAEGERGPALGAYFVAKLKNGECHATYLTKAEIEEFRSRSRNATGDFSPWTRDWNAMACKTAVRRGVNLLPRTEEVQAVREAIHREEALEAEWWPTADVDDEIPMPRSKDESAQIAQNADGSVVRIKDLMPHAPKKAGEQPWAEVVDSNGIVYRVDDMSLVDHLSLAHKEKAGVVLTTEQRGDDLFIIELRRVK
jgi:phage RecT family recombinase